MSWEDLKYLIPLTAAVVAVAGWLVNDWLTRRTAAHHLLSKKIDYMRALSAEIKSYANSRWLPSEDLQRVKDALPGQFNPPEDAAPGDPGYVPFVPSEKHDTIFEAIVHDIHVLPSRTIYPVVVYYSQIRSIRDLGSDMRSPEYAALSAERREALMRKYLDMVEYSYTQARKAIHALSDEIRKSERTRARVQ
ncbi:MAG: hypothetical protein AAFV19_11820 [Pseudomonadota bacterium]